MSPHETVLALIAKLCPNAKPQYVQAFRDGGHLLASYGITTSDRIAHFLAQVCEETGGLTITHENGNYSAARIRVVWPSRPGAVQFAHNPEGLFNNVYANRMGNGSPNSGDGWLYRGRGILQTTGREAYRKYGKLCGVNFEANPDLIVDPRYALLPALAEWKESGCNALADKGDLKAITKRINGGYTNLDERIRWYRVIKAAMAKMPGVSPPKASQMKPTEQAVGGAVAAATAAVVSGVPWVWIGVGLAVVALAIGVYIWRSKLT